MIGQIRPGPKELEKRRWGPRDYDPRYYLYQDIDVGDPDSWKDPKPLKHPSKLHETESGERVYTSRWGTLNKDLREKFANHLNWTSDMRDNIIGLPILNAHKVK
nr:hypothetical protein BaRGS_022501 [Batillaria attramentaria]